MARFGEGVWHIFSMFVCITSEHCDFAKTSKKHRFLHCFVKAELLKINEKSTKFDQKSMQIWSEQGKVQKLFPKIDLGWSWGQFWRGLGHSGASFGNFWAHFGHFFDVQCGTWRLFGVILSILGALWVWFFRFWEPLGASRALFSVKVAFWNAFLQNFIDLGRFWLGLGRVFGTFFRCFLHYLGTLRFCKNIEKTQVFTLFCKGRAFKN